eukprot:403338107
MIKTNIQVVVFLFNTFKATSFTQTLLPVTNSKIRNNSNLTMLALTLSFCYKVIQKAYKLQRRKALQQYEGLPKDQWKNDYPIVLVHGFGGWVPDESFFFGDYFAYASYPDVQGDNKIYQADIAPWGSLHDRACELYQQLIGIFQTQRNADRNRMTLAEQVYGKEHFDLEHREQYYKTRYLRRQVDGKTLAYPNGIPEGWNRIQKIHFVGHSQGGQTVRYLQYLLKIDYFNDGKTPKTDKSDWIASFTGLNPILNGGIASYMFDLSLEKEKFVGPKEGGTLRDRWFIEGCKIFTILQNLVQNKATLNVKRENIKNIIKQGSNDQEVVYELAKQPYFFFDFNQETIGHNRREGEKIIDYVKRVMQSDVLYSSNDYAVHEFCPVHMKDINSRISEGMSSSTYYFTYAAGIRNKKKTKQREVLQEPKQLSKIAMGFDLDIDHHMKFNEHHDKIPKRLRESPGFIERIITMFKVLSNIVSINNKVFYENLTILQCPAKYLNNILNPNMNNTQSFDYANKDLTDDSDMILPRWTQEFPKFASNYQDKFSQNKPWGQKSEPVYFDNEIDSRIQQSFDKGVWYYSSLQMSDHHDLAGFPNKFKVLQTILGREFRPQVYINIFNRLRTLEYVECTYLRKNIDYLE